MSSCDKGSVSFEGSQPRGHPLLTSAPAFVIEPVRRPIHQCSVTSLSMGVLVEVVRTEDAPCSISRRIFIEQIEKNLRSVLAESARAKHDVSCETTRAELDRIDVVTCLKTMSSARSNRIGESCEHTKSHAA